MEGPNQILHDLVLQHNESLNRMEQSINNMVSTIQDQEARNAACREKLLMSVPDGDHDGHRRWHEAEIKRIEARAEMWQDLQKSVAKWGVIALLGWIGVSMWHEAIATVKSVLIVK